MLTNQQKGNNKMKKYKLIYTPSIDNKVYQAYFMCANLLELHKDVEKYKAQAMIYDDQILEIEEVA
jgi:hypothetical protein